MAHKVLAQVSGLGAVSSRWVPLCGGIPYHHFPFITAAPGIIIAGLFGSWRVESIRAVIKLVISDTEMPSACRSFNRNLSN